MRWIKVAAVVVAALIAFVVLESVWHLLEIAAIVLAIGVVIALALKARHQYRLARERRARLKAQCGAAADRERHLQQPAVAPAVLPPTQTGTGHDAAVEEDLARLKRELGAR